MKNTLKPWTIAYALAALVFLALDAVWLSTMTARLYRPAIGHLMAAELAWLPVLLFYPAYLAGLLFFAVRPALRERRARTGLVHGALLGLLAYATYDLTNHATLVGWPWLITVIDMAWGAFVSGMATWAAAAGAIATSRPAPPAGAR